MIEDTALTCKCGCGKPVMPGREFVKSHHRTMASSTKDYITSRVLVDQATGCWNWTLSTANGYGQASFRGSQRLAHIQSFIAFVGDVPDGMILRHKCDNRRCCNPEHLQLGTKADNSNDMVLRGRSARGESHSQSKLTKSQVRSIFKSQESQPALADKYSVDQATISNIKRGRTWSHVTGGVIK